MGRLGIELDDLAPVVPVFIQVQEVRVDRPLLRVANNGDVCKGVIEQLSVSFGHTERNGLDNFSLLLRYGDVIQVD